MGSQILLSKSKCHESCILSEVLGEGLLVATGIPWLVEVSSIY